MKKIALIFKLLFASITFVYGQSHSEYAIYDTIITREKVFKPVKHTSLGSLKSFNFKDQTDYMQNLSDTLNNEWKSFLNNIDLSNVKADDLDSLFLNKYSTMEDMHVMVFSPIVISLDGSKAICAVYFLKNGNAMYLFEKKNGKWFYRKHYIMGAE